MRLLDHSARASLDSLRAQLVAAQQLPHAPALHPEGDDTRDISPGPYTPAAVLVAFVLGPQPGVLLTKRTSHLAKHAGQVSFAGGRIDPEDVSPEAAAIREAQEEIGLDPSLIDIIGRLPDYITGTSYRITPVLAVLPPGRTLDELCLSLSPDEVESVFELKLDVLLDPASPRRMTAHWRGRDRVYWEFPHPDYHVWGATAAILVGLAARLRAVAES